MRLYNKNLKQASRDLRNNLTDAEKLLWSRLRNKQILGLQFYRQKPILNYIVDFYCHEIGLVIELDGGQHGTDDAVEYDAERTKFLEALGLTVVRYWNHDVFGWTDVVLEHLWSVCIELKNTSP